MSKTGASTPNSCRLLLREVFVFTTVGTVLGVATVIIVYRIMAGFRDELLQRPGAADDPMLREAIAGESNTMLLVLAPHRAGSRPQHCCGLLDVQAIAAEPHHPRRLSHFRS
jgi:hypothetical protein